MDKSLCDGFLVSWKRIKQSSLCRDSDTKLVYAQGKNRLAEREWMGAYHFRKSCIPELELTAYTRYMRNYPMACFPKKYIALLNTVQTTEEDNVELFSRIPLPFHSFRQSAFRSGLMDR